MSERRKLRPLQCQLRPSDAWLDWFIRDSLNVSLYLLLGNIHLPLLFRMVCAKCISKVLRLVSKKKKICINIFLILFLEFKGY